MVGFADPFNKIYAIFELTIEFDFLWPAMITGFSGIAPPKTI